MKKSDVWKICIKKQLHVHLRFYIYNTNYYQLNGKQLINLNNDELTTHIILYLHAHY